MSASATSSHKKLEIYTRKQHRTNTILKSHANEYRLIVSRSLKHISAQIVAADGKSITQIKDFACSGTKMEKAFALGQKIASAAQAKNINTLVFDRNGYLYHGRVAKFAQGAREGGLQF